MSFIAGDSRFRGPPASARLWSAHVSRDNDAMRFGIDIAQQRLEWSEIVDRARFAEELGFEGLWGFDHFKPMYGQGPGNCFEGMTTLAALATATTRIRLGLLVTGVTYRHPSVLTAEAVTIDHASNGRLDLALGAAWFINEHEELGIPFPPIGARVDLLEDTVEIVKRLCTGDVVSYQGRRVSLVDAQLRPVPVQRPHPPIWIGASGEKRTLPLTGRYADAWHCYGGPEDLKRRWDIVKHAAEEAGRDPRSILRSTSLSLSGDLDSVRRSADAYEAAGLEYLVCGWPGEGRGRIAEFVEKVLPALA
jgi:alkanesulfonate monooxygenase SsuD/methylene tetrahydromethanopterin reductase-like flavin-dependent oxidoreductase (luciferase family)